MTDAPRFPHPGSARPAVLPLRAALVGLALWAAPARADDGVPKLDIEATCRSAQAASVSTSDNASLDGCLRSEREAHAEVKRRWGDYTPEAKAQCSRQSDAGGYPSYVETVTCLELASGTVPSQPGSDTGATSGPGAPKGAASRGEKGSALTAEPAPSQRTNPIDILNKP